MITYIVYMYIHLIVCMYIYTCINEIYIYIHTCKLFDCICTYIYIDVYIINGCF